MADGGGAQGQRGPSPDTGPSPVELAASPGAGPVFCLPGTDADRGVWAALGQDRTALALEGSEIGRTGKLNEKQARSDLAI